MVLNSLLQEQPDGSFHWTTDEIEVRVYQESFGPLESGETLLLGWRGYIWPVGTDPWTGRYLFNTCAGTRGEVAVSLEGFFREKLPGVLPEGPPSALSRLLGDEYPF